MAQERIDDFIQLAKDYAKAEKDGRLYHRTFRLIIPIRRIKNSKENEKKIRRQKWRKT